ncbi:hypothetical protein BDW22DRAFT_1346806 [Trametopsis cervina]|nr:hypothetical protein BDW22DRAFT_1346806 [Trametopsis cervina]
MPNTMELPLITNIEQTSQSSPSLLPTYTSPAQLGKQAHVPSAEVPASTAADEPPAPRHSLPVRLCFACSVFIVLSTILGTSFGVLFGLYSGYVVVLGLLALFPASRYLAPFAPALANLFPAVQSDAGTPPAGFWALFQTFWRLAFVGGFAGGALWGIFTVFVAFAALIVKTRGIPWDWRAATVTRLSTSSERGPRTKRSAAKRALVPVMMCILPGLALSIGSVLLYTVRRYLYGDEAMVDEVMRDPVRAAAVALVGGIVHAIELWIRERKNRVEDENGGEQAVSLEESLRGVDAGDASNKA